MNDYLDPATVKDPIKVRVGYRDGNYWLELYSDEMQKAGLAYVEIDKHLWMQWQAHCAAARAWSSFCQALEVNLYESERGADR